MFISTIHDLHLLGDLKAAGIDAVIIGVEGLSIRQTCTVALDTVHQAVKQCHDLGLKIYINALRFFMEDELSYLKEALCILQEAQVDGVYYSDEGVFYQAQSLHMERKLIYQPETLITNHKDILFYLGLGLQSVSLAHECSLDEIIKMTQDCKNVEILISGYFSILYSRRQLVTNYLEAIGSDENGHQRRLDLVESTRTTRMPIVEDDYGTHIYSEGPIQSSEELSTLMKHGLYRFRIDSLFFDDAWTIQVVKAYQEGKPVEGLNHWYYQKTLTQKEAGHEKN